MFLKLNPRVESQQFDLRPEGYRRGDLVWLDLVGDFRPSFNRDDPTSFRDAFQNTAFRLGGETVRANPDILLARSTELNAFNRDPSPLDNSDPDGDYGVEVRLAAFTSGADEFRFTGRPKLPDVLGSAYNARAGDDVVVMPGAPLPGFNADRTFRAGAGDDTVRTGDLDLTIDFGTGVDTLVLGEDATVAWSIRENRDGDGTLVVTTGSGRQVVTRGEVVEHDGASDPLVKWYFNIVRDQDGACRIEFLENGQRIAAVSGVYDEALPVETGVYQASFARGGALGRRIELDGAGGSVAIHAGTATEGGFAAADFIGAVFARVAAGYAAAGAELPWSGRDFAPLVPLSVGVRGEVEQPFLAVRDIATDDARNRAIDARFRLEGDGDDAGLEAVAVQVFFTAGGAAELGEDWEFAGPTRRANGNNDFFDGVLRHGRDADGDQVYSVMIEAGERGAQVPIRILEDANGDGAERLILRIAEVDLWHDGDGGRTLYRLSGGPRDDRESDLDGPRGAEELLVRDPTLVVTIDDLIG
jgi:hypothetical protein